MGDTIIPGYRILHRAFLDDPLPDTFAGYGDDWDRLHPAWVRVDWLHSRWLPTLHPTSQALVDRAQTIYPRDHKRFVADVVRLELLWFYGGVWVDTDVQPVAPLDPLLDGVECFAGRSPQHIGGRHPVTNAVMGARPRHPFVGACIAALPDAVDRYGHLPLARSVGPWLLTRVYESGDWPTVTIFDADTLYGPESPIRHMWHSAMRRRGAGVG